MTPIRRFVPVLGIGLALVCSFITPSWAAGSGAPSLARFLTPDGQPDLERIRHSGYQGPLSLSGYDLAFDPIGASPVFVKASAHPGRSTEFPSTGWIPTFTPAGVRVNSSGSPLALAIYNGALVVGGSFLLGVSGTAALASNIALWDGHGWKSLASGLNMNVNALTVYNGDLIAGGAFTQADSLVVTHIASWDGSSWSPLGSGVNGPVNALVAIDSLLYVGGAFGTAGGTTVSNIAAWNGTSWRGVGALNNTVNALAVRGGVLYAGGDFDGRAASLNGSQWHELGKGLNQTVRALVVTVDSLVVVGGDFTTATDSDNTVITVNRVAVWNGGWAALSSGFPGSNIQVRALAIGPDSSIVAGGTFAGHVATYSATSGWAATGGGLDNTVSTLAAFNGELLAGGVFTSTLSPSSALQGIARWTGSTWLTLGAGTGAPVRAMVSLPDTLYVGGDFSAAGALAANGVARWAGSSWSPLGAGVTVGTGSVSVTAAAVFDGKIVFGGNFDHAGGQAMSGIAGWDGTNWSALGSGLNAPVKALAVCNGALYAGGNFSLSGTTALSRIAKWDGSSWTSLGTGMTGGNVLALTSSGNILYVGGTFTQAGQVSASHIAAFNTDTHSWAALGLGTDGQVSALTYYGNQLFAGGLFTHSGGIATSFIARWDSTWHDVDGGVNGPVTAFALYHDYLVVAGSFTTAGSGQANGIARWSRSAQFIPNCPEGWGAFGSLGITAGNAVCLNSAGNSLFGGGSQLLTDGYLVNYMSLYYEPPPPDSIRPAASIINPIGGGYGRTSMVVSWTEVGDDSLTGTPLLFDVRYRAGYAIATEADFEIATPIAIEPPPQGAGTPQCVTVNDLSSATTYWFAMKTLDHACHWSAMSNVVSHATRGDNSNIEVMCTNGYNARPSDVRYPTRVELLGPVPSPSHSHFTFVIGLRSADMGSTYDLALFDVAGRRIAVLDHGVAAVGYRTVSVSLTDFGGMRTGVYFARLLINNESSVRTVILK